MGRLFLTIAIFVLAGAVVNVAVAWAIARWFQPWDASVESTSTPSAWLLNNVPERWPDKPKFEATARTWWFLATVQRASLDDKVFGVGLDEQRMGVPTKSLANYRLADVESGTEWRHAWGDNYRLPLCPIWPGFAINTFFYAGILWLLTIVPFFALRRLVRLKRGLCPKCAYPMGESKVCTECGRELPRSLTTDRE